MLSVTVSYAMISTCFPPDPTLDYQYVYLTRLATEGTQQPFSLFQPKNLFVIFKDILIVSSK
jgi:hypothetical protein